MGAPIEVGQRHGDLVVEGEVPLEHGYRRRWRARCDCGATVIRTARRLHEAMFKCCATCAAKERRVLDEWKRETRRYHWHGLWLRQGTLYSAEATTKLELLTRQDMEEAFGPLDPEPAELPLVASLEDGEGAYCGEDYAMTLVEIGAELGLTRQRVQQIEAVAIRKLRAFYGAIARGADYEAVLHAAIARNRAA